MAKQYTDAQRAEYWRKRALGNAGGGSSSGYSKRPSSGYSGSSYSRTSKPKNSGCKVRKNHKRKSDGKDIGVVVTGWLKAGTRFLKYVGVEAAEKYQKTDNVKLSVKVTEGMVDKMFWGTFNPITNMVYIQDINICGMPSKNSSFFRKDR